MNKIEDLLKTENCLEVLQKKGIDIKYDLPYILLKYNRNLFNKGEAVVDLSDPIVRECRGLIIKQTDDGYKIVCRPFRKWFNVQEEFADDIDWSTARVQEKIDGSLIKLWFDEGWHWSTMGAINADYVDASVLSFGELIKKAENYNDIPFDKLDKDLTYLFELVSPYNQIVVKYDRPYLYHIGTRSREGQEYDIDIGIRKPEEYPLGSLDECIEAATILNPDTIENEGFVVVDKNWNRIKIKSPKYVMYHRLWNNGAVKPEDLIKIARSETYKDTMNDYPLLREPVLKMRAMLALLEYEIERDIRQGRQFLEEYETRKATAEYIKKLKHPYAGFWAIDHEGYAEDYIEQLSNKSFERLLKNYEI